MTQKHRLIRHLRAAAFRSNCSPHPVFRGEARDEAAAQQPYACCSSLYEIVPLFFWVNCLPCCRDASMIAAAACCALTLSRTAFEAFLLEELVAAWLWWVLTTSWHFWKSGSYFSTGKHSQ